MDSPLTLDELVRAARTRVPLDAAELLRQETPDRIAAVLGELPAPLARLIGEHLPQHLQVPEDRIAESPGLEIPGQLSELMEPACGVLAPGDRVADAIRFLREHETPQQITYLYVVDAARRLCGMVVIRDLLLADPGTPLSQVMLPNPFALPLSSSTQDAIKAAVYRHYPVYPVVDDDGRLAGLVRGWRLFERQAIEITAQPGRMVGVDREERVHTGIWAAFRQRHPWLQLNLLTAFLAAFVVGSFEETISQIVALAAFLPVLAGQSGNNGCQALAITLRGYTLGDLERFPLPRLIRKEMALGAMNGLLTGFVAALAMWWVTQQDGNPAALTLAAVIWVAMIGACMVSGFFGVMVPITLKRLGADPATASSIFLTTGTDITSMGLMLTLATVLIL